MAFSLYLDINEPLSILLSSAGRWRGQSTLAPPPHSAVTAIHRAVHHQSNPGTQREQDRHLLLLPALRPMYHRSGAACTATHWDEMIMLLQ